MYLYLTFAPLAVFAAFRSYHLILNYLAARKFGVPIIVLPVSFEDLWWMPLRPLFAWVEKLPFGLGDWYVYTTMGWGHEDGHKTTGRLGETFVLCSPSVNQVVTSYGPALDKVFKNNKNWPHAESQSQLFAFYGQNLSSTNGEEWKRHRKITASAFNEKTMHAVWKDSILNTMAIDFIGESARTLGRIRSTFDVLAMQVLASVGFGQEMPLTTIPPGHQESLMDSLGFILQHVMLTLLFNSLKAPDILLPGMLRRLKVSVAEFRLYMKEAVLRHMQSAHTKTEKSRPTSLLEAMVKANEMEKQQSETAVGKPSYLTESELYGNLFVFNLAGYETTAGTMTFALPFLAAHPDIQDWVIEEIDRYYSPKAAVENEYVEIYPKLVRCLSTMYETLRLSSPAPLLLRDPLTPQELPISTSTGPRTITVNPGTSVSAHYWGAHLSPRWTDPKTFNPKRFVAISSSGEETLEIPEGPVYGPWISGPRVCPGKKFSQVEFVAVVAQILSRYCIEVQKVAGESEEAARTKLFGVLDKKYFNISTHLVSPEDAGITFVRRAKD
ncbi:putative cytochrome P450 [Massariosphaeria phaeospora]|uniref:Putative cytochrome P450 n=1 Tax=Massariosphaeria phaeospora TaxID=100035 RepID=A0A7C8IGT7_9PLEO|nr:putative cytochrome P450 [Massariosphaeria phaeospora]